MVKRKNPSDRRRGGFTLIEVLLVLTILVIIASLAVMAYGPAERSARMKSAKTQIGAFKGPLEAFRLDCGSYPASLEDLRVAPPNATNWNGPYLDRNVPLDPWGRPYQYQPGSPDGATPCRIVSSGPDGMPNTADDITSD